MSDDSPSPAPDDQLDAFLHSRDPAPEAAQVLEAAAHDAELKPHHPIAGKQRNVGVIVGIIVVLAFLGLIVARMVFSF